MKTATTDPARGLVRRVAESLQTLFSSSFPLVLVSLCGVSYLAASALSAPEFGLWGLMAMRAVRYARFETWAAIALGLLVAAALPLVWVALRQREARPAKALGEWAFAVMVCVVVFGLHATWPFDAGNEQIYVYSFLLFVGWNAIVQALLSTIV